ncbi:MAG: alpha-E domain-containing protein [Pirellulaceae bacterium]|nr:alpha-E domain-containing protein [Pirellulaceae bacterium]
MLSRVADSVFWMSRYIERAENVARFIDVNYNMTLDVQGTLAQQWAPLVATTGDHDDFAARYDGATRANVLQFLAFDEENPNSILSCLQRARENARTIREVISSPMWEEINKFYHMVRSAALRPGALEQPYDFCNRVKLASHLLVGVTDTTMSHEEAWHFARMGRLIERADKTSRIVDVKYYVLLPQPRDVGTTLDVVQWSALLKSASALEMYRRRHGRIVPQRVAEFLMLDRHFPRSIRFCLIRIQDSLRSISGSESGTFINRVEQRVGLLRAELDYTTIDDIVDQGLHEFIDAFQTKLNEIGMAIYQDFFTTGAAAARTALRPFV